MFLDFSTFWGISQETLHGSLIVVKQLQVVYNSD